MRERKVDVVGLGENATDIVMRLPSFPAPGGKQRIRDVLRLAGGSVASALVACGRLGLRVRYLGAIGDDDNGRFQLSSLRAESLDLSYLRRAERAHSRVSHIAIDESTGERTIFWERDPRLDFPPRGITPEMLNGAGVLHLDSTDLRAALTAARLARQAGMTVVADLDTMAPGIDRLLPLLDYPIVSSEFLAPATGERDPFRALERLARNSGARLVGVTLGRDGALVLSAGRFVYSAGFHIEAVDTTGAGDIFHGAFIYGLVRRWELEDVLNFANAMAALNSTALGARGGIATESAARRLMVRGRRNVNRDYVHRAAGN